MKLAAAPVLLFTLFASPVFSGVFDNVADEYQKARKEHECCVLRTSLNRQAQSEVSECKKRLLPKDFSMQELLAITEQCVEQVYGGYCPETDLQRKEAECIKEGFSQQQCAAASEAGKLQAYQECHM